MPQRDVKLAAAVAREQVCSYGAFEYIHAITR